MLKLKELTPRQWLGWILITLSCLAWAALPIVPFLPLGLAEKGAWTAGLLIFAEVTWWPAMPLLGPEIVAGMRALWAKVKGWFTAPFKRSEESAGVETPAQKD